MNRRLLYRVFLKFFASLALLIFLIVLFNSLFIKSQNKVVKEGKKILLITLNLENMKKGEIRKVRWGNKEVAVLLREKFTVNSSNINKKLSNFNLIETSKSRSLHPDYFVYYNQGDSGNCPLFYERNTFKDVCTGALFDTTGRSTVNKKFAYQLKLPPHFIDDKTVIIGAWEAPTKEGSL